MAIARDEQILGLEIAVHDAAGVRGREPARDLNRIVDGPANGQRSVRQFVAERPAFEQFVDDKGRAVVLAGVEHHQDVGVVEGARRARFLRESPEPFRVGRDIARQRLEGDIAPEPHVPRPIDDTHAAFAYRADDFVRAHSGSSSERHGGQL